MANWIAGAIKHPGALHRQLGVPQGQKIPAGKLASAAQADGKLGQRARLVQTLKGLGSRAFGGPVAAGKSYLVGERGPEIMRPRMPGQINPLRGVGGIGGGMPRIGMAGPNMNNLVRAHVLAGLKAKLGG